MKVECNEGSSGAWAWRVKSDNGKVVANGASTYETEAACVKGAESFAASTGIENVVVVPLNADGEGG